MKYLSLSISGIPINAPSGVPTGGINTVQKIIQIGITILFVGAIVITFFYLIQGGIQWIVSGGDKQRIEQARLKLTYAVVGLVVVLLAFFIINFVSGFFNIKFF